MGKTKQPTYRLVAADSRSPRNGRFIEILGTYEPRQEPSRVNINGDKALDWLRKGAQPTERVQRLLEQTGTWAQFKGGATPSPAAAPAATPAEGAPAEATPATEATS
jgi:small subunit ribosomal protein S16